MDLKSASRYFADTPALGWNGAAWEKVDSKITLLPFDQFISEREFGNKRRYALCDSDKVGISKYTLIKLPSDVIYMVGVRNYDMQEAAYQKVHLLHLARYTGKLYSFTKAIKASGMAGTVTRTLVGTYNCDVERVSFANSQEFDTVKFTDAAVILPLDCLVDTDHEIQVDDRFYDVRESYVSAGFRYTRCLVKRST